MAWLIRLASSSGRLTPAVAWAIWPPGSTGSLPRLAACFARRPGPFGRLAQPPARLIRLSGLSGCLSSVAPWSNRQPGSSGCLAHPAVCPTVAHGPLGRLAQLAAWNFRLPFLRGNLAPPNVWPLPASGLARRGAPCNSIARPGAWSVRPPGSTGSLARTAVCPTWRRGPTGFLEIPSACFARQPDASSRMEHRASDLVRRGAPCNFIASPATWSIRPLGSTGSLTHPVLGSIGTQDPSGS